MEKNIHRIVKKNQDLAPRYEVVAQLKAARKEKKDQLVKILIDKTGYGKKPIEFSERKEKDLTQEELAKKVGTKKSNISRFESGRYNPSLDFLIKVAGSLGKELQINVK